MPNELVTPSVRTYEGFKSPDPITQEVSGDGTTVITYTYLRKTYNLNIIAGRGISAVQGSGTYKYGQIVNISSSYKEGYENKEYQSSNNIQIENDSLYMPAIDVDITVVATPKTYTISYELNNGNPVNNPTSYTVESPDLRITNPNRDNYSFKGWSEKGKTEMTTELIIRTGTIGNKIYVANWEEITGVQYTVRHLREDLEGNYTIE